MTNKTLLLAEDSEDDVFFMERALQRRRVNCTFRIVKDGQEAIDYLSGNGQYADRSAFPLPSLMILDIKMPRVSGLEVLEWIRNNKDEALSNIPIVMLTSSSQQRDIDLAYSLGANSYLVKPIMNEQLEATIQSVTDYWLKLNISPSQPS